MRKYPISSYNKHICLKANALMFAIALYLLKPYVLLILSAANRKDRGGIIDMFYPVKTTISLEAAAAIPLLFLAFAWTRRASGASAFVQKVWRNGKALIMVTAILQLCLTTAPFWLSLESGMTRNSWIQAAIYLVILIVTPLSTYMKDCFSDFPESKNSAD